MKKLLSILISASMLFAFPAGLFAEEHWHEEYCYDNIPYFEYINNFTSIEEMAFQNSDMGNPDKEDAIIVVNSNSLDSDGLSASGLIGASNGAICAISNNDSGARLKKLLNNDKSKVIYFIGGEKVIPKSFKDKFKGYKSVTLAGANRIETSYRVAEQIKKLKKNIKEFVITNAYNGVPDSVSIASESFSRNMPVILTNGKSIPFSTNGKKVYAIGGTAVISDSLVKNTNAIRLGGKDRYETNQKILRYFNPDNVGYSICYGESKGNNMKVASLAGCLNYKAPPMLLVSEKSDKSILKGASDLYFYTVNQRPSNRLRADCYNATFGQDTINAANAAYKVTGDNKKEYFYVAAPTDNYVMNAPDYKKYKNDYYIFKIVHKSGDISDINILVKKSDKSLLFWGAGEKKPMTYNEYMDMM